MKRGMLGGGLLVIALSGRAQNQEKIEQILKLGVYIKEIESGYKIVQKGLTTIGELKKGHLSLDHALFSSLSAVNPQVSGSGKVGEVQSMAAALPDYISAVETFARSSGVYGAAELSYIKNVYAQLQTGVNELTDQLHAIVTAGSYQMSDGERLKKIEAIDAEMLDRYTFAQYFGKEVRFGALQRQREAAGASTISKLY